MEEIASPQLMEVAEEDRIWRPGFLQDSDLRKQVVTEQRDQKGPEESQVLLEEVVEEMELVPVEVVE